MPTEVEMCYLQKATPLFLTKSKKEYTKRVKTKFNGRTI